MKTYLNTANLVHLPVYITGNPLTGIYTVIKERMQGNGSRCRGTVHRSLNTYILKNAELPVINLHALRHTFATRGLESGIEMKVMQELLGHDSIAVTADIYSHVFLDKKKSAIDKLKDVFSTVPKPSDTI